MKLSIQKKKMINHDIANIFFNNLVDLEYKNLYKLSHINKVYKILYKYY